MPTHNHNHNHHHHHHVTGYPNPKQPTLKLLSIFLKFIIMSLILSTFLLFLSLAAILLLLAATFLHRRRHRHRTHLPQPFKYHPPSSSSAVNDCSICLEFLTEGEMCRGLPVCGHVFHATCVDTWLMKVPNCPVCRTRVGLEYGGLVGGDESKFLWAMGVGS